MAKIFLNEEDIEIRSAGQLDEIIVDLEEDADSLDKRSKGYKEKVGMLHELYRLYNEITNHKSYNV